MSSPADHVKDIPYFALSKDWTLLFPQVSHEGHHVSVNWGGEILGGESTPAFFTVHCLSLLVVTVLLFWGAFKAASGIRTRPEQNRGVTAQLFEVLVKFLRDDVARPNLGHHGEKYIPFMLTFFFLILFSNLWGMVPILLTSTATGNINVTVAFAAIVLLSLFLLGIREQGLFPFIKNLVPSGVPWWTLPLMYPIELLGPLTKCFALCIRLFANMVAGHIVLAAFSGLAMSASGDLNVVAAVPAFAMSVAISLLEVFVAFLQAYIFTLLTSVFLGAFIHPDH